MGPEIMAKFLDPGEYVKRLAAAQGIDVLNLVKTPETMAQEKQQQMQQMQQQEILKQAGQFAHAPAMDPSKNPAMAESFKQQFDQVQDGQNQGEPPPEGAEETPA
jgi:23S rRNA pseudoU1915 N3-methylase RlmH